MVWYELPYWAYDAKPTTYRSWWRACNAEDWGQFVYARAEAKYVFGATIWSRIMSAPGILWSTPPVHISGGRHWKARSLVWNLLFLLSGSPEVVWWWLLLRKPHSLAFSLTARSVSSGLIVNPLFCFPESRCNYSAFLTSVLLCLLLDLDTYGGVYPLGVFPLFLKKVADTIAPKRIIIFRKLIRLGSFPECWRSANLTAIPKLLHPLVGKTTDPYQ